MMPLLALLIAYLLGAIPFGYLLVEWTTGADVRASGSGNIGATNVLRTTGRAAGIATLLLDIAKGYAAVWIAGRLTGGEPIWMSLAALAVMAGHAYPVFLRISGRQGGGQLHRRVPVPDAARAGLRHWSSSWSWWRGRATFRSAPSAPRPLFRWPSGSCSIRNCRFSWLR